eukprot:CAMPEP_0172548820 /NCGR_PEP_ID=MMETSP1067-20121228/18033_1 /TAXON_ID=265564 ORGANISM="Thalassiosira punctigera, Strain Tpunct2005C2" /NCGR_SAMPLE_ID=MMETSP1067 /ASSEMBLY_ACC=CAM_ASM_000444 /LENGTH=44 /DNA_ID= /DNA_START= /DNA_END= /DNA_ORIENTATION=
MVGHAAGSRPLPVLQEEREVVLPRPLAPSALEDVEAEPQGTELV